MKTHDVQINLTEHGRGKVLIDGYPVQAFSIGVNAAVDGPNVVTLALLAERVRFGGVAKVRTLVEAPSYFEFNARRARRPVRA